MSRVIRKMLSLFTRREKACLAWIFLTALLTGFFQALGVASILPFMNLIMNPGLVADHPAYRWLYQLFQFQSAQAFTLAAGAVMLLVILLGNALSAYATWLKIDFVWKKNHALSRDLLRRYLDQPYAYFLHVHTSELAKNILIETNSLTAGVLLGLLEMMVKLALSAFILVVLLLINIPVTLITVSLLSGAYALIYSSIRKKLESAGSRALQENMARFKAAHESLSSIKEIKIFGRASYFIDVYSRHSSRNAQLQSWNAIAGQMPRFVLEAIAFGSLIFVVLVLTLTGSQASQVVPLVSLYALAGYRLMPAMQTLFKAYAGIRFNEPVLDKILQDMKQDRPADTPPEQSGTADKLVFEKSIRIRDITYTYPDTHEPVLEHLSLAIPRGSQVAIFGPSGTGKTTLVDILLGLLTPQSGCIEVDQAVIGPENLHRWQRLLGYVPQQISLLDDTIASNIAFGVPDHERDMAKVREAARQANLAVFIEKSLLRQYQTMIGEQGIRLSGGQRQRIGIARALYHQPDILVFDEATNELDRLTEEQILKTIRRIGKTLIVITHRLQAIEHCDIINIMEKGRITASGTYRDLW